MPLLQVRDIPEDLYELLAKTAEFENRSIAQETVFLLKKALNYQHERSARKLKVLSEIQSLNIPNSNSFPDPSELIREDRER